MRAKKKLSLMEFGGSIITAGLFILNLSLLFGVIWYSIIGEDGIATVLSVLLVLFSILIIPIGSFVMSAGLKWPEVSTLIFFFYVSLFPIIGFISFVVAALINLPEFGLTASTVIVFLICYIPIRLTVSFCTKRGKAYRQKLLEEIAAEEAALPQENGAQE